MKEVSQENLEIARQVREEMDRKMEEQYEEENPDPYT